MSNYIVIYSRYQRPTHQLYEYEPLPTDWSIRLLKCFMYDPETFNLCATLKTFSLDQPPSYHALSYTWGYAIKKDDEYEPGKEEFVP
jgi:hypothetical protein